MLRTLVLSAICLSLVTVTACSSKKSDPASSTSTTSAKAKKGSTQKGATASKGAGQKSGSSLTSHQSQATDQGAEYEQATCDADLEGTAWCGDDHTAIFCAGGHWYSLDCASIDGDVCAETADANVVDCDAPADVE
jgi:hypothetical protein